MGDEPVVVGQIGGDGEGIDAAKRALRSQRLAARALRGPAERRRAARSIADVVLGLPEVARASTVACYASLPDEPGTSAVIAALVTRGTTVLLPVLLPDLDLDWAAVDGTGLRPARYGIPEPVGPPLGVDAVASCGVVICPGLAADYRGNRLGRGGGSYDRALARTATGALRIVLLYADELLPALPMTPHDQPVHAAVTPVGVTRLGFPDPPCERATQP